ncbi:hypothetical protein HOK51_05400 [Candidatus Woesearchaeota archaeon]|jgi:tetratricopeptide (TPR) repeat protein|nr:hypothetical protein [Candidatus Woesearchaeota archaeon]MBT6519263.1 hypothetical protein [Candidatus Woesearchaeota archaeon]MBT7368455.1 hypothetical protein [Candidatus Woesearchaeota archaeon]
MTKDKGKNGNDDQNSLFGKNGLFENIGKGLDELFGTVGETWSNFFGATDSDPKSPDFLSNLEEALKQQQKKSGQPNQDPDPKATALIVTFQTGIHTKDKKYLTHAVVQYREDVFERTENGELLIAYTKACTFVGNLENSLEGLKRQPSSEKVREARGLVAYAAGNHFAAAGNFKLAEKQLGSKSRIAYSLALHKCGGVNTNKLKEILSPLLDKSGVANAIIGCAYSKEGDSKNAEEYLEKAAELNPTSEKTRLDLMRTKVLNGNHGEVNANMNQFYVDTGSQLSVDEIESELDNRVVEMPNLNIKNVYTTIDKLI